MPARLGDPDESVTQVLPGDRVLLCSDQVGEQLARLHREYPARFLERLAKIMREPAETAEPRLREVLGPALPTDGEGGPG